jgi:hypothetical protein
MAGAAPKIVQFPFPLLGLNQAHSFAEAPPRSSIDLLNVRPFDAEKGRARGGSRPGLSKKFIEQPAGGDGHVQGMIQAVLPGMKATLQDILIEETFNYGAVASDLNGLGGWRVMKSTTAANPTGVSNTVTAGALRYKSGAVPENVAAGETAAAVWNVDIAQGQAFTVYSQPSYNTTNADPLFGPTPSTTNSFKLLTRVDRADWTNRDQIIYAHVTPTKMGIYKADATPLVEFTFPSTVYLGNSPRVQLDVSGDQYKLSYGQGTYGGDLPTPLYQIFATAPANDTPTATGVGFAMDGGMYQGNATTVSTTDNTQRTFYCWKNTPDDNDRITYLVAVINGSVYLSNDGSLAALYPLRLTYFAHGGRVSMAAAFGKVYICDGVNQPQVLNLKTLGLSSHVATVGTVPTTPKIVAVWRGRVLYSGVPGDEQNIFASRAGSPDDWQDAQQDRNSAWALNAATAGAIGQPVLAMVPYQDDVLIVGCDHATYSIVGDPAAGGTVTTAAESVGWLSNTGWCQDEAGRILFAGTGGIYRMSAAGAPANLSAERVNEVFRDVDRSSTWVSLAYDRDNHGCWIFLTPRYESGTLPTHYWYDARTEGFFPMQFGLEAQDPTAAIVFDGDLPTDRVLLLGGRDGYVRQTDDAATTDDGETINSHALIGPQRPGGFYAETQISAWECVLGTGTTALTAEVLMGASPEEASAATPGALQTFDAGGRRPRILTRYRANAFFLKLSGTLPWQFEGAQAVAAGGGSLR